MTLPPNIRIFFAIALDDGLRQQIGKYLVTLKKAAKTHGIRWSKPENLHVTLQFLDNVKSQDLPVLLNRVRVNLSSPPFSFSFTSPRLYPSPYRPRVIVLDVAPQDTLANLSRLIGESIAALGYAIEDKPYRAHLTLGRVKQPHEVKLQFLTTEPLPLFEQVSVTEVVLFRSEPEMGGSLYTPLARLPLT
jgi:RNA 2',3'-cyclic 3'-phosphodiesterase